MQEKKKKKKKRFHNFTRKALIADQTVRLWILLSLRALLLWPHS